MLLEFIATAALSLNQWPQFRGPKADGHVTAKNVPAEWSDTKNVAWKVPLPGLGWSSPVLGDGKICFDSEFWTILVNCRIYSKKIIFVVFVR